MHVSTPHLLNPILKRLPSIKKQIEMLREVLLTNLVMISEIPAPTFHEERRVSLLLERLGEYQLQNCSSDEMGNALGILPGTRGDRNLLIVAHLDTVFPEKVDHTVTIQPEWATGVGLGDNGLGVATVATLPIILERLNIELDANLILMGSSRSLGKGDIKGIRFFLENSNLPIHASICVEGVRLGRLSYSSIGMLRGKIVYEVPEEYDWTRFGAGGAIVAINEIINHILEIPLPRRPRTSIVLNSVDSGASYNTIPTSGSLQFEIRSESAEKVWQVSNTIQDIGAEISSKTGAHVTFEVLARRQPGGIQFSHPLAVAARTVLNSLDISPRITPSTSELSAFIDHKIPAVTIGLTDGDYVNERNERIALMPIDSGVTQLVALILSLDAGYGDGY